MFELRKNNEIVVKRYKRTDFPNVLNATSSFGTQKYFGKNERLITVVRTAKYVSNLLDFSGKRSTKSFSRFTRNNIFVEILYIV